MAGKGLPPLSQEPRPAHALPGLPLTLTPRPWPPSAPGLQPCALHSLRMVPRTQLRCPAERPGSPHRLRLLLAGHPEAIVGPAASCLEVFGDSQSLPPPAEAQRPSLAAVQACSPMWPGLGPWTVLRLLVLPSSTAMACTVGPEALVLAPEAQAWLLLPRVQRWPGSEAGARARGMWRGYSCTIVRG